MTLKEINRQIEAAHAAYEANKVNADGSYNAEAAGALWDALPRVYYADLPAKLKKEADKITVDKAKRFLYECYPVGTLDKIAEDQTAFNEKIVDALHAARYLIESTNLTPPKSTGHPRADAEALKDFMPVSLIGADLMNAWEQVSGLNTVPVPRVPAHRITKFDFPIDKVNNNVWQLLEETEGQLRLLVDTTPQKRGRKNPPAQVEVLYSIDFSSLENMTITRKLEPYDRRVYLAIAAFFNDGHDVMSIQQIYNAMGYTGRMSATDIKKINAAITKMSGAHIFIDNIREHNAYKYDHFKYDGSLLPMERIQASINGQLVEAAIHVFREPPMVSFARDRKQITTLNKKLLDTPLSKTNANIQLEDYLLEQIAHMKKGQIRNKMLYATIYEKAGITQKKQKQRAPEKIKKLLQHYVSCGYISAFKETSDGVEISYKGDNFS